MSIQQIVSHTITLPLQVRFVPTKLKWVLRRARVVELTNEGWPSKVSLAVVAPLGGYRLCVRLLEEDRHGLFIESQPVYSLGHGREVDVLRGRYHSGSMYSLLGGDEIELLIAQGNVAEAKARDPWQMRDEFLALRHRSDDLVVFLNKWGSWDSAVMSKLSTGVPQIETLSYVAPELIWERQAFYKAALSGDAREWLTLHADLPSPQRQLEPPYVSTLDTLCSKAIETTITIDKLRDVPYKICAKEDCGKIFRLYTKHNKQFCSHACAHLTAVRRGRLKKSTPRKEA